MQSLKLIPPPHLSTLSKAVSILSSRELQVLDLISREYSTKEIAQQLSLSPATIESHRKNLRVKLNCRNVAGIVRRGFELGFLIPD